MGRTALGKRGTGEILAVEPGETLEISLDPYMRDSEQPAPVMELTVGCLTDQRPLGVIIAPMNTVPIVVSRKVFKGFPDTWKHLGPQGNPAFQYLYLTASDPDSAEIAVHEVVKDADIGMDSGGPIHIFNMASHTRREQGFLLVMGGIHLRVHQHCDLYLHRQALAQHHNSPVRLGTPELTTQTDTLFP